MRIAFFDAKEYDVDFFTNANKGFDFELRFFADRLDCSNADMASGFDAVCCFVIDVLEYAEQVREYLCSNIHQTKPFDFPNYNGEHYVDSSNSNYYLAA